MAKESVLKDFLEESDSDYTTVFARVPSRVVNAALEIKAKEPRITSKTHLVEIALRVLVAHYKEKGGKLKDFLID